MKVTQGTPIQNQWHEVAFWLPLPHKQTPKRLNKIMVHGTWTACLVPWGCWPTVCCCWSAGWAPPVTGSTAAVAAAAACSATGWRRDQGCSLGCHSWSLHGEKKKENVSVFHFFTSLFFLFKNPQSFTLHLNFRANVIGWLKFSLVSQKQGRSFWNQSCIQRDWKRISSRSF